MIKIYNDTIKEYFYGEIQEELFKAKLLKIFKRDDSYLSLFLITNININFKYIDDELLKAIFKVIKIYKRDLFIDDDKKLSRIILKHLNEKNDIKEIIRLFSLFDTEDKFIVKLRDFFNYSDIYKYYRYICNTILKEEYNYKVLYLVMRLLNNEKLVFQNLLPVFKRITTYAVENIVENNIISCSKILKALVLCAPKYILKKEEYTISLLTYLVHIFYDPNNFTFINFKDSLVLLDTIEEITQMKYKDNRIVNIAFGIFADCYNNLKYIIESNNDENINIIYIRTCVYEDVVVLVSTIKLIIIFYKFSYKQGSRMYDYKEIYNIVKRLFLCKIEGINEDEWYNLYNTFIYYKYKLLDILINDNNKDIGDSSIVQFELLTFDTKILCRDLEFSSEALNLVRENKNIIEQLDYTGLSPIILKENRLIYSLDFLTKNKYIDIRLYIHQLEKFDKQEELALFTYKLIDEYIKINNISILQNKKIKKQNKEDKKEVEDIRAFIEEIYKIEINNKLVNGNENEIEIKIENEKKEINIENKNKSEIKMDDLIEIGKERINRKSKSENKIELILTNEIILDLYFCTIKNINNTIILKRRDLILEFLTLYYKDIKKIKNLLSERCTTLKYYNPHLFIFLYTLRKHFNKRNTINIFKYLQNIIPSLIKYNLNNNYKLIVTVIANICIDTNYFPPLNKIIFNSTGNEKRTYQFIIILIYLIYKTQRKKTENNMNVFIIEFLLKCTQQEKHEIEKLYYKNLDSEYLKFFIHFKDKSLYL